MTHVIFCKLLYGGFILGENEHPTENGVIAGKL